MALTSMKLTASEVRDQAPSVMAEDAPEYPWGLTLHLGEEELEKLGFSALPTVGQQMRLEALVEVTSTSESNDGGETRRSVTLQVTDAELGPPRSSSTAEQLYGDA